MYVKCLLCTLHQLTESCCRGESSRPRRSTGSTSYAHLLTPITLTDSDDASSSDQSGSDNAKGKGKARARRQETSEEETSTSEFEISGSASGGGNSDDEDMSAVDEGEEESGENGEEDEDISIAGSSDEDDSGSEGGGGKRRLHSKLKGKGRGGKAIHSKPASKRPSTSTLLIPDKPSSSSKRISAPTAFSESPCYLPPYIKEEDSTTYEAKFINSLGIQFSLISTPRTTVPTRRLVPNTKGEGGFGGADVWNGEPQTREQRLTALDEWSTEIMGPELETVMDLGWWKGKYEIEVADEEGGQNWKGKGKMKEKWGGWYDEVRLTPVKKLSEK